MPIIKIKSRLTANNIGQGTPPRLSAGELAYNENGLNPQDNNSGGSLSVGTGTRVKTLISSQRQVELAGDQTIVGVKTFRNGLRLGSTGNEFTLSANAGQPGQALRLNAQGDAAEWAQIHIEVQSVVLAGTTGTVHGNINAETQPLVIKDGQITFIEDTESGSSYAWVGSAGSYGAAAGEQPATITDVSFIGSSSRSGNVADLQAGVANGDVVTQAMAISDLFRTDFLSGNQIVTTPVTIFQEKAAGDGAGKVEFHNDVTGGAVGSPIEIQMHGGTIKGAAPAEMLTLDNVVLDAGTF